MYFVYKNYGATYHLIKFEIKNQLEHGEAKSPNPVKG